MNKSDKKFMAEAVKLSFKGMRTNQGGPFGAVIVKNGKIIGRGLNRVTSTNDPTAHAEIVAIRDACQNLKTFRLDGCCIYTSSEPCPMCFGAIHWARINKIFFACTRLDAANIEFDDNYIYKEIVKSIDQRDIETEQLLRDEAIKAFELWRKKHDKIKY